MAPDAKMPWALVFPVHGGLVMGPAGRGGGGESWWRTTGGGGPWRPHPEDTPRRPPPACKCRVQPLLQTVARLFLFQSVFVSIKDLKPHLSGEFFFKPLKMFIFIQLHVVCVSSSQDASVQVGGWVTHLHPLGNWR